MELLDIINDKDEVIGTATRDEAHSNPELMHRAVHFTLINPASKSVLISQRSFKKKHDAGKFCFFGEHVLSGESYIETTIRGVKEELGIEISNPIELAKKFWAYNTQTELVRFFVAECSGNDLVVDKNELEKVQWLTVEELRSSNIDFSEMTQHWIDVIDWDTILK